MEDLRRLRTPFFAAAAAIAMALGAAANNAPLAPHKLQSVAPGAWTELRLNGYDLDGDNLAVTIESLPETGTLYQLTSVYSNHGYEPTHTAATAISAVGTVVTGSKNRLIYQRPTSDAAVNEYWDRFSYTVSDGTTASAAGFVTLVNDDGAGVLVGSDFSSGDEGWKIAGNKAAAGTTATHEPTSRGVMNHFVYGTDDIINRAPATGTDDSKWHFEAPTEFLGHHGIAYGGQMGFTLSSFSGDFSSMNHDLHLVEFVCDTCDVNAGVTIAFPLSSTAQGTFDGSATTFTIPLTEDAGWLQDSKNTLIDWATPSKCTFIEVLSGLSRVRILGDFTTWYESVSLDSVTLENSLGASQIPICAQGTPDASTCTCA